MKFEKNNLSVEYWKNKLKKYKGKKRKDWCNKIINYIIDIQNAIYRDTSDKEMKQLNICIKELNKIRDDERYEEYERIAKMWTIVKEIERSNWTGREWWQLKLITHGSNRDRYPNLKL